MRMGVITDRRRRQRAMRLRRRLMIAGGVLLLGALAMAPGMREKLSGAMQAVQTFGESAQLELTLPQREIYALQLAVFDSGERAASEAQRLQSEGVRCIVWQKEKMRIVVSAAFSRDALDREAAMGHDAYVIEESLEAVTLQLSGSARALEEAKALLEMPDDVLKRLLAQDGGTLESILADTGAAAQRAVNAHPDNALYTQLAQSLINWCALMDAAMAETQAQQARSYAAVTMCTLCRELRLALQQSAAV